MRITGNFPQISKTCHNFSCLTGIIGIHVVIIIITPIPYYCCYYLVFSDAELNWPRAQSDPGICSHSHVLGCATGDSNADILLEPIEHSPILLSLCGGLGDDGELTHGMFRGKR